jgi:hypothetical protein
LWYLSISSWLIWQYRGDTRTIGAVNMQQNHTGCSRRCKKMGKRMKKPIGIGKKG